MNVFEKYIGVMKKGYDKSMLDHTPIYQQVLPDLVLIGVTHNSIDLEKHAEEITSLKQCLQSLDFLAFEGTEQVRPIEDQRRITNYENIAESFFESATEGVTVFLDKGVDYIGMMQKRGVSPTLYHILRAMETALNYVQHHELYREDITEKVISEVLKQFPPKCPLIPDIWSRVLQQFPASPSTVFSPPKEYLAVTTAFTLYVAALRDQEIYAPRLEKIRNLDGKKGAILGKLHLESLEGLLHGTIKKENIPFRTFAALYSAYAKKVVDQLEQFAKHPR